MKTVTIKNGENTLSVDTHGAQLRSFISGGLEYIWQRDPKYWDGSAPVLFPIVGELKGEGKTTIIDGKPYHMDLHGFASDLDYEVNKTAENEVLLIAAYNEDTLKQYPFKFRLTVGFKLTEKGFTQSYKIENLGENDMPYIIGAHPGFNLPLYGDNFEDYTLKFEKPETAGCYRIDKDGLVDDSYTDKVFLPDGTIPLKHSLFNPSAMIFENLNSHSVQMINKEGKGVQLDFPNFNYFGVWHMTKTDAPYCCLEPWTGMNDCYSEDGIYTHKKGIRTIAPKSEDNYCVTATIIGE